MPKPPTFRLIIGEKSENKSRLSLDDLFKDDYCPPEFFDFFKKTRAHLRVIPLIRKGNEPANDNVEGEFFEPT